MKKSALIFIFVILLIGVVSAGSLKVTQEHPFLINGEWVPASSLKIGDELTTLDNKRVRITSIRDINLENPIQVYNLEANIFHDFIVENGVVVHNSNVVEICFGIDKPNSIISIEELIDFFGKNPIENAKPIPGINKHQIMGFRDSAGDLWIIKKGKSGGPENEIAGDLKPELVGREINDYLDVYENQYVRTPEALLYIEKDGNAYLIYRYVEGSKLSAEKDQAEQLHKMYRDDIADRIRAKIIINQILGGFKDTNEGGFIITPDSLFQIDMEYISSADTLNKWEFIVGLDNGIEPGFSTIPQYNNQRFINTLRCMAEQELSRPRIEYSKKMRAVLKKAGYKGIYLEKKLSELIENRDKLLKLINQRIQWLAEDNLLSYNTEIPKKIVEENPNIRLYVNPKDIVITDMLIFPEQYLSSARIKEIDAMVKNGVSAKDLNDQERIYYAKVLLGKKDFTEEEIKTIIAAHRSEGLKNKVDILRRSSNNIEVFSKEQRRELIENWVTGDETDTNVLDLSRGRNTNPGEDYIIRDPYELFSDDPAPNLNKVKAIIKGWERQLKEEIITQEEYDLKLSDAQEVYGNDLIKIWHKSDKANKKIINAFLKALKIDIPRESSVFLPRTEVDRIVGVFRNHRWKGLNFGSSQKDIFRKYGLKTKVLPSGHIEVYYVKDPTLKIIISSTPSRTSTQAYNGEKITELINRIYSIYER